MRLGRLGQSPICRWVPLRQPTIVFRREKSLEASVAPPQHAPRASQGRPRPYRASASAKEVSDLPVDRPSRSVSATCRARTGNPNRMHKESQRGPRSESGDQILKIWKNIRMVDSLEVYLIYKKSLETCGLLVQMENLEHLGLVDTRKSDRII